LISVDDRPRRRRSRWLRLSASGWLAVWFITALMMGALIYYAVRPL